MLLRQSFVKFHDSPQPQLVCHALFQTQIARYPKNPSPKIFARLPTLQMLEQQQERLLNNLFSVVRG